MSPIDLDRLLGSFRPDRRGFLKSVILGTAYAAPVVASFSMDGLVRAAAGGVLPGSNMCVFSNTGGKGPDVLKTASPGPFGPGDQITYTIQVENCTNIQLPIVRVSDELPEETLFVSSQQTGGVTTFTLTEPAVGAEGGAWLAEATAPMQPGDLATFEIVVSVKDPL